MAIKDLLLENGKKLLSNPSVTKALSDERVLKAVSQLVETSGRVQEQASKAAVSMAKSMGIATHEEVRDLKRKVRKLERELGKKDNADDDE